MFEDLATILQLIAEEIHQDNNSRWYSWTHCYAFFQNTVFQANPITDDLRDHACLHLAFYLASWGMYRGSSFLLREKTFTFFRSIINVLCDNQYIQLRDRQFPNGFENNIDGYVDLVTDFYNAIGNQIQIQVTDWNRSGTLITKIMLGTTACVPAYDSFFKNGLHICGIPPYAEHPNSGFSRRSLQPLIQCLQQNNFGGQVDNLRQNNPQLAELIRGWPLMKIVDAYFWRKGR